MSSDASTETGRTGTEVPRGRMTGASVPGPRTPGPGETSSPQSGPFTGLVTALRTATAARPVVPEPRRPSPRQLAGVCAWAAVLALAGIMVGLTGGIAMLAGHPPHWYLPSLLIAGGVGIGLTSCAFLTVRQVRIPWVLLAGGTAALITSAVFTAIAAS